MPHPASIPLEERAAARAKIQAAFAAALDDFDKFGHGVIIMSTTDDENTDNTPCEGCGEIHPETSTRFQAVYVSSPEVAFAASAMVSEAIGAFKDEPHLAIKVAAMVAAEAKAAAQQILSDNPSEVLKHILGISGEELKGREEIAKASDETPSSTTH